MNSARIEVQSLLVVLAVKVKSSSSCNNRSNQSFTGQNIGNILHGLQNTETIPARLIQLIEMELLSFVNTLKERKVSINDSQPFKLIKSVSIYPSYIAYKK